jgi:hypothetical protein
LEDKGKRLKDKGNNGWKAWRPGSRKALKEIM